MLCSLVEQLKGLAHIFYVIFLDLIYLVVLLGANIMSAAEIKTPTRNRFDQSHDFTSPENLDKPGSHKRPK